MPSIKTDSILWYNVGLFGPAGYAVPNWGLNTASQNQTIQDFVDATNRNLFAFMHHDDCDLRTPPSINSIIRVDRLCKRARTILAGRAIAPGKPVMETVKANPAPEMFKVYPCPFFGVRNRWLKTWAQLIFTALAEAMQHTENRRSYDISNDFAGLIGQYFTRVYTMMAVELFGIDQATASAPGFLLTDAQLAAYDPSKFFTSTELVDNAPPFSQVFTAEQLYTLSEGIPIANLPELGPYPSMTIDDSGLGGGDASGNPTSTTQTATATASAGASAGTAPKPAVTSTIPAFPAAPSP
jgi:hypothetical protein